MTYDRKVSPCLCICFQDKTYNLSHIPGVSVGGLVSIKPTKKGVLVSRVNYPGETLVQPE